ncbi:MAG: hypothetical protein Q9168_006928 [Polycauliona sp. 1 TL-2023]
MTPSPEDNVTMEDSFAQDTSMTGIQTEQQYAHSSNSAFDQLVALMYDKLPQELVDLVEDKVMEELLCPGYIFPWKHDGNVIFEGKLYQAAQPEYLTLSKKTYRDYERRMQTENTYMIGTEDIVGAQILPPARDRPFIRRAHVYFDLTELEPNEDSHGGWNQHADRCSVGANCGWCGSGRCYQDSVWIQKSRYVTALQMEELTLDLRGCHRTCMREEADLAGGDYWELDGTLMAHCSRYFRFDHGLPERMGVVATNSEEERDILHAIHNNNRPLANKVMSVSYIY